MKHGDSKERYELLNSELKKRNLNLLGGYGLDDLNDKNFEILAGLIADRLKIYEEISSLMVKEDK